MRSVLALGLLITLLLLRNERICVPVDCATGLPVSGIVVVLRACLPEAKREAGAALRQSRSCPRNCKR
jgi:hypothetical protein